jgi:hypothetical protein
MQAAATWSEAGAAQYVGPPGVDMPTSTIARGDGFDISGAKGTPDPAPSRQGRPTNTVTPPGVLTRAAADLEWLIFDAPYRVFEVFAFAGSLVAGVVLAMPASTFDSASAFHPLARLFPEWAWALVTLVPGLLALYAWARESYWAQVFGLFAAMLWFSFVGTLLTIGNSIGFAWLFALEGVFLIVAFCRLLREWEARAADTRLGHATAHALALSFRAEEAVRRRQYRARLAIRRFLG